MVVVGSRSVVRIGAGVSLIRPWVVFLEVVVISLGNVALVFANALTLQNKFVGDFRVRLEPAIIIIKVNVKVHALFSTTALRLDVHLRALLFESVFFSGRAFVFENNRQLG